jgi:hypothetical protein
MSKYKPTRWKADHVYVVDEQGFTIAVCDTKPTDAREGDHEEAEANARLIAQSPAYHAIAKRLIDGIYLAGGLITPDAERALRELTIIYAKAEGEDE